VDFGVWIRWIDQKSSRSAKNVNRADHYLIEEHGGDLTAVA